MNSSLLIQPDVFKWVRLTSGYSIEDVAHKMKKDVATVEGWESGSIIPSYPQLEKLAYTVFKRPVALFFLPKPPEEKLPKQEFRTLPSFDLETLDSSTYFLIRLAHAQQLYLYELFKDKNPSKLKIWKDIKLSMEFGLQEQAQKVRDYLGITIEQQYAYQKDEDALKSWRNAVENAGIFVFKNNFKQNEISGFCLVDEEFPVIYLNNSTAKTRQIFSLLHELAHLLFDVNGLSKFDKAYIKELPHKEKEIERFCDALASEILVPDYYFEKNTKHLIDIENQGDVFFEKLAKKYNVSREVILRKFLDKNKVSKQFYGIKREEWINQLKPKATKGGGNYYLTQNVYLSSNFTKEVLNQYYNSRISLLQASDYLNIKPKNFNNFEMTVLGNTI